MGQAGLSDEARGLLTEKYEKPARLLGTTLAATLEEHGAQNTAMK